MASLSCSSWCAEPKASSRISVSSRSFIQSSVRSSETAVSSCSASSVDSMILERIGRVVEGPTTRAARLAHAELLFSSLCTHTEDGPKAEVLQGDDWFSPLSSTSWGIFGELGAEESGVAISSMSEYVLAPFLMLNALLKELLSYRDKRCRFTVQSWMSW